MSRTRIVVADQAEAVFYDTAAPTQPPREVARIADTAAHLHDREFSSDRPGRGHAKARGTRHAFGGENDPRHREAVGFARHIANQLEEARQRDEFDDLVVVAGPAFLGLVRQEMSKPTRARVVHEVHKDLVHSPVEELRQHLAELAEEPSLA
ncbi:MAG TPA: host attachment protein [Steroidobacteraceae bacterium]